MLILTVNKGYEYVRIILKMSKAVSLVPIFWICLSMIPILPFIFSLDPEWPWLKSFELSKGETLNESFEEKRDTSVTFKWRHIYIRHRYRITNLLPNETTMLHLLYDI